MATLAPPVVRDKFFYSSILYANAGNDNHHPRASVAELTALLRPEAPKGKKAKTPAVSETAKDHPWHFWTAQLLHYGLTSTKDKNAAKIRLLGALNEDKLEVPGWIKKLEAEVKKEWEAENRRLKKSAKETTATPVTKKAAAMKSSQAKESVKKESTAPAKAPAKASAAKSSAPKRKHGDTGLPDAPTPAKKAKPRVKKEPASGRSPDYTMDCGSEDIVLSGTYSITSGHIEDLLGPRSGSLRLVLYTDETTGTWWAKFYWAMLDGIMKIDPGPTYETIANLHTLGWRICNQETGRLTFGRNCTGKIQFDWENRTLQGIMYDVPGVGDVDFSGERIPGPRRLGSLVLDWDRFVDEAYGR